LARKESISLCISKQVRFGKVTTLENVLKACAREFLDIEETRYEDELSRRNLDLFLLEGEVQVTDPTFPFNKTSFYFSYLKVSCSTPAKNELRDCFVYYYYYYYY